jgi:hypothetical protein
MDMFLNRQGRQGRQEKQIFGISIFGVPGVLAVDFILK